MILLSCLDLLAKTLVFEGLQRVKFDGFALSVVAEKEAGFPRLSLL
jgi:hypothetical protein